MKPAAIALVMSSATTLLACSAVAQVSNQSFQVTEATARPTVGDTVVLTFRVRLDERDLLFDTIPQPIGALPTGVRILAVEKLQRSPDRIFHGHARLAFYRPGRQPVPVFGLPFMRSVKGVQRATLLSDSAFVNIVPLLPAGNPPLKDIKGLERPGGPALLPFVAALAALLGLTLLSIRRRRKHPAAITEEPQVPPSPEATAPTTYQTALAELDRIGRENWPARGDLARHYAAAADTLRDYLEAAHSVPARERTSAEVLWSLSPHLAAAGLRDNFREILDEADLVKFARLRPEPESAEHFLEQCRALLHAWHHTPAAATPIDAIR